ncbi:hypothetical protein INR49_007634 [Caranx melampygus]|nr:hypothetical protein INR49_007634 [Caranx melampygus]
MPSPLGMEQRKRQIKLIIRFHSTQLDTRLTQRLEEEEEEEAVPSQKCADAALVSKEMPHPPPPPRPLLSQEQSPNMKLQQSQDQLLRQIKDEKIEFTAALEAAPSNCETTQ